MGTQSHVSGSHETKCIVSSTFANLIDLKVDVLHFVTRALLNAAATRQHLFRNTVVCARQLAGL